MGVQVGTNDRGARLQTPAILMDWKMMPTSPRSRKRVTILASALALAASAGAPAPADAQQGTAAAAPATAEKPTANYWVYVGAESADKMHRLRFGPDGFVVERTWEIGEMPAEMEGPHGVQISKNGKYLFVTTGHGFPMTYAVNGRQYIAMPIGVGTPWIDIYGKQLMPEIPPARPGNAVVVFALPRAEGK